MMGSGGKRREQKMSLDPSRAKAFCKRFGLKLPILLAPMAGACPPSLSIAMMNAGSLGAGGALLMQPNEIVAWADEVRAKGDGPFQLNLWIPDPPPRRDREHEDQLRAFLHRFGPEIPSNASDATLPDFAAQCEALLAARPPIVSSVMGLYPPAFVARLKSAGITWVANVSTVAEARAAEEAGADVVAVQGMEAGGHRGAFDATQAERQLVGLFALIPAAVDAVKIPVVATGGIGDGRGVAAALLLGASAAQIGTALLRSPEAKLAPAWADVLARTAPEDTVVSRAFSGRPGRSIATAYVRAAIASDAPPPAPYPIQRGLTLTMRRDAERANDIERMQAWAGQSARLARAEPAGKIVHDIWKETRELLGWDSFA
jgi:nitronate monooxygenase